MPGAGKSTIADALVTLGFSRINMGDVVREEASRKGAKMDDESLGRVMLELRKEHGNDAIAKICLRKMDESLGDRFVIDGLRSMAEAEVFRRAGTLKLIGVHASPSRRLRLLKQRGRGDAPVSESEFRRRDQREKSIGVLEVIESADAVLCNEDVTIEELQRNAIQTVKMWMEQYEGVRS